MSCAIRPEATLLAHFPARFHVLVKKIMIVFCVQMINGILDLLYTEQGRISCPNLFGPYWQSDVFMTNGDAL